MNKEGKKDDKKKKVSIRTILIMIVVFLIGFDGGVVCTVLLEQNDVFAFKSISQNDANYTQNESSVSTEETTSESTTTTEATTTTTEATTTPAELPTPVGYLYPDMTVEKLPFKEDVAGDKVVYITFDDGPWSGTPELLDLLDKYNVKATFFVTAQYLDHDQLVSSIKEIYDRGHAVAVHTYSHDYDLIYSSVANYVEDYHKMDDIILEATGERSHIFRLPGGSNAKYSNDIRTDLLTEMNYRGFVYHDWNAYDGGCDNYSIAGMISKAVGEASAHDKGVLLMHDTKAQSFILQTLPDIISQLKDQGYRFDKLDGTVKPYQFETVEDTSEVTTAPVETSDTIDTSETVPTTESYQSEEPVNTLDAQ